MAASPIRALKILRCRMSVLRPIFRSRTSERLKNPLATKPFDSTLPFARSLKQNRSFHVQSCCQAVHDIYRCTVNSPLERTDVSAVEACAVGKLFLRKPFSLPCRPQVLCKNLSDVHLVDFAGL